ncbi:MAG: bifunctional folylpolyglutamate synthase/dihydrofolate synthase [Gammaproteobacteria bacterium]|jgi:dihydrofolate synthase/folylpolyglutamate synthase|nr:bifunctional folylpolyglutamate synthase/dihydrofolate synthase [Gammaproteobacteria bacterium]MBT3725606.1 bifunctional folylpolyglutamate synthase/dihydrofolate synthase [Gammaproteobacteria bacterium]MBT4078027.1 bifunctional folylpolyglutamate synthase/dihydrofolate synthase [Gammaproteobacteria bacterium]MBT4196944.1 bifunctional folylpolyglutamate synthase/dihydrofolate synthase [Gammaproteobacteria bacterium]MBT4449532.1 bifunctional folylpolyglutamate synthase/dihydrofolate synthase 
MRFKSLESWLDWQQSLNPKNIELGLDRVKLVYQSLDLPQIADTVITVAGTNGKGSTVAYYETWLQNSGYKVASYTSPHLIKYNERIKLNLESVSDDDLCSAFSVIDEARGDVALTYFEFGTLAALYLISQFKPDVAILEVGLGGRLDAVNIIDADLAHITPIGLDHQDWLGDTVESIAYEKAGILRDEALSVCNMTTVPDSLKQALTDCKSQVVTFSRDYDFQLLDDGFIEWSNDKHKLKLKPPLLGYHQALNISGVLAGLSLLGFLDSCGNKEITSAFKQLSCPGRLQNIETSLPASLWVDVGHNEDAAEALAQALSGFKTNGRIIVLLGMLSDKNPAGFVAKLKSIVDEWWVLGLDCDRGLPVNELTERISSQVNVSKKFNSAEKFVEQAVLSLHNEDIILVCGSFMTVEAILSVL